MMNLRALLAVALGCLLLTGCLTDKDEPIPSPLVDCTNGIPQSLLTVSSYDEMIERYAKPTSEVRNSNGGLKAIYTKLDVAKVYGCETPSNQVLQYQIVEFDFDNHRRFLAASSRLIDSGNPVARSKRRQGT